MLTLCGVMTMAIKRRKQSRKSNSYESQFIGHLIEMQESPAWRVLSLSALRVIFRIEIEYGHHGGQKKENGRLPVTFDQFEAYGIERHSIGPAIQEVVALGFIVITKSGRAGVAEFRRPNWFRITYRPAEGLPGDGCTHEWRCVSTMEQAKLVAKKARSAVSKKQNPSGGKPTAVSGETPPKTPSVSGETPPKSMVGNSTLLSRYLGEEGGGCGGKLPDETTGVTAGSTAAGSPSKMIH